MRASNRINGRSPLRSILRSLVVAALVVSGVAMSIATPAAAAALPYRIDLKVLVLDNNANPSVSVDAIKSQMQVEGVPFTSMDIANANITSSSLSPNAEPNHALYQAVVVPDYTLAGLSVAEISVLRAYEAKFGIREVDAYNWANPAVGLNYAGITGDINGTVATVTPAGLAGGFGYLNGPVPFSAGSWSYIAEPLAPASLPTGSSYTTLLGAPLPGGVTGSLIGVYSNAGVEQLVITSAFSYTLPQFKYVAHGIITWATRGVHFGYNRNNFTFHVDDAFNSDSSWNTDLNCTPGEDCTGPEASARMTPDDVTYAVNWEKASGYQLTLAFNGFYADPLADPLTQAFQANASAFRWLNHGFEHIYQGCVQNFTVTPWQCTLDANGQIVWETQPNIYNEIENNINLGHTLGLTFDATEYLSGEHSGLFYLPQQPIDNPNFAAALTQAGILHIASDASRDNVARQVGTAVTIPRHPTALYYNTSTRAQAVDEYNWLYTSRANGGSGYCEDNPATATCIPPLDPATGFTSYIVPTDAAFDLNFILSNDPRPFYAHTSNLTGDRLAYNLLDAILGNYNAAFTPATPLVNMTLTQASTELLRQTQWTTDINSVTGYVQNGQVSISNSTGHVVPFTVPTGTTIGGNALESYGGESSAWLTSGPKTGALPTTSLNATGTVFVVGQSSTLTMSAAGIPTPTVSFTGTLPAGLTAAPILGGWTVTGTPATGTEGSYPLTVTTISAGHYLVDTVTLTVSRAPQITSTASATAVAGHAFTFTVVSNGSPTPALTLTGALPAGITFAAAADGTATLSGTTSVAPQTFPVTLTATNVGGVVTQSFVLTVSTVPQFTSSASATPVSGSPFSFTVTTTGSPTPALTFVGALPTGITFTDLGNGTATLSGTTSDTPQAFPVTLTATNAVGVATQTLTLNVSTVPQITSANSATAVVGAPFTFAVTSSGSPAATITLTGTLPAGISFAAGANGTATLSGTTSVAPGSFPLMLTATNPHGVSTQSFTLTVSKIPQITSAASATAVAGVPFSFAVTSSGSPVATVALTGALPAGITFTAGANGTATLSGTTSVAPAVFPLTLTATNSHGVSTQSFMLTVSTVPHFTSAASASVLSGTAFSFAVATSGSPTATVTYTGSLPAGISFTAGANGTATLSGQASMADAGHSFPITLTATNAFGQEKQAFTLAVDADFMSLISLTPARLADTRQLENTVDGLYAGTGAQLAGSTLELLVTGRGGVPSDASAVALNVTVAQPAGSGFVTVYPCGAQQPLASNLNFTSGAVVPNAVIAQVGTGGKVCLFVSNSTHLVVDVTGYFPSSSSFHSMNPARVLDTRPGYTTVDGLQQAEGIRQAGTITAVRVRDRVSIPADATAIVLNVTVTEAQGAGFLTVYPCGTSIPTASNVNYVAGSTVANLVISKVGSDGNICIYNSEAVQLVVDVDGFFPAATSYRPLDPARLLETRPGLTTIDGQLTGAGLVPAGTITEVTVAGRGGVAADAATVVLNLTVTDPTMPGFITAFPCGIGVPLASNLNFGIGTTVGIAAIVRVGSGGKVCLFNSSPTQLVVDVNGYLPN